MLPRASSSLSPTGVRFRPSWPVRAGILLSVWQKKKADREGERARESEKNMKQTARQVHDRDPKQQKACSSSKKTRGTRVVLCYFPGGKPRMEAQQLCLPPCSSLQPLHCFVLPSLPRSGQYFQNAAHSWPRPATDKECVESSRSHGLSLRGFARFPLGPLLQRCRRAYEPRNIVRHLIAFCQVRDAPWHVQHPIGPRAP